MRVRPMLLALCALAFSACLSEPEVPGGGSHFLGPCDPENPCADGFQCVCGYCTLECFSHASCGAIEEPSSCVVVQGSAEFAECRAKDSALAPGVCLVDCQVDEDCPYTHLACVRGVCTPWATEEPILEPGDSLDPTYGPIGIGTAPVHAGDSGVLFLAGESHLLRSTDGGGSWTEVRAGKASSLVQVGNTFVALFEDAGVMTSGDLGTTWFNAPNEGIEGVIYDLAAGGGKLYAVAGDRERQTRHLLFVSSDLGATWEPLAPLPDGDAVSAFLPTSDVLLATGLQEGGLYRSVDGGQSWSPVAQKEGVRPGWATALAEYGGEIFAVVPASGGVFRSPDRGLTWMEDVVVSGKSVGPYLPALAPSGKGLFATLGGGDLYRWQESDRKWVAAREGLPENAAVASLAGSAAGIWLGIDELIYVWNGQRSWVPIDLSLWETRVLSVAADSGVLLACTGGNSVHVSRDQGKSWIRSNLGLPLGAEVLQVGASAGTYYLGTARHGIYFSYDATLWNPGNEGVPRIDGRPAVVTAFVFDRELAWAALSDGGERGAGVIFSVDGGLTWTPVTEGLPTTAGGDPEWIADLVVDRGVLFAALPAKGVYRMQGEGWEAACAGLPAGGVVGLASTGEALVAAVVGDGKTTLYRSDDGGSSWASIPGGQLDGEIHSLEGGGGLLAVSLGNTLLVSTDGGANWRGMEASQGRVSAEVGPMALSRDGLYLGTMQAGVWRLGVEVADGNRTGVGP